jgi:periplasmic protein TonB
MAVSTSSASLFSHDAQQRALLACVGASIVLHAAVLVAFPELRRSAPASPPMLTATLVQPAARTEPAPVVQHPAAEPRRPKPKPKVRPVARPDRPPEIARSAPLPAPAIVPEVASAPELPPREVAEAPSVPPAPPTPPQAETQATPAPVQVRDGATVQQYRMGVMAFAKQFKRYPVQAMERGWQGRVEIRITVRPSGTIESALIKTPSGHQILDDQALDMVRRALARTPVPAALLGREFSVDIPVIFELQSG